jgi:hypothetical protein
MLPPLPPPPQTWTVTEVTPAGAVQVCDPGVLYVSVVLAACAGLTGNAASTNITIVKAAMKLDAVLKSNFFCMFSSKENNRFLLLR